MTTPARVTLIGTTYAWASGDVTTTVDSGVLEVRIVGAQTGKTTTLYPGACPVMIEEQ